MVTLTNFIAFFFLNFNRHCHSIILRISCGLYTTFGQALRIPNATCYNSAMPEQSASQILERLQTLGSEEHRQSKARLGVPLQSALGVPLPVLRQLAKDLKRNHPLALDLWASGYHEARLLAALLADPAQLDAGLIGRWVEDVVSWDLCDHLCANLLHKSPVAIAMIPTWAVDEREFVRRAGIVLILYVAMHQPEQFHAGAETYFALLRQAASDPRTYIKKAVSWTLREIGKRFDQWQARALALAHALAASQDKHERWVGKDALKELAALVEVAGRKRKVAARTRPE